METQYCVMAFDRHGGACCVFGPFHRKDSTNAGLSVCIAAEATGKDVQVRIGRIRNISTESLAAFLDRCVDVVRFDDKESVPLDGGTPPDEQPPPELFSRN